MVIEPYRFLNIIIMIYTQHTFDLSTLNIYYIILIPSYYNFLLYIISILTNICLFFVCPFIYKKKYLNVYSLLFDMFEFKYRHN